MAQMKSTVRFTALCGGIALLLYLSVSLSSGQAPKDLNVVQVESYASHERIHPGESFQVAVVANIKKGFHLNSHTPLDKLLIPTVVKFDKTKGVIFSPASYPEPRLKLFSFSPDKLSVYEGKISIFAMGKVSEDIPLGDTKVSGVLVYQACDDQMCLMPKSARFEIPLKVVNANEPTKLINSHIFQHESILTSDELQANQMIQKGLLYAVIAFFLFGLALNLTPCVYPVIPMTVGFFLSQGEQKKWRMFLLSLYYVTGIAIVFSVLGLISGLAGKQWGFLFQSPWFVIFIAVIILSMAASMFGAFEITLPSSLMTRLGRSRQGAIGSFVMGLTVGVVVAPCAAGIIIGLVGVVAKLGLVAKGALLFFVMGLGLGLPYLFLGTFSGLLSQLPKSGMWMVWVRKLFGVLLIGVALYFLVPHAKQINNQEGFYLGVLGIFGGLLLGFLERGEGYTRTFNIIRGFLGLLIILSGVLLVNAAIQPEAPGIDWVNYRDQSIEELQKENRPILIDFYADWCAVCKELDRKTFRDQRVVEKSRELIMVRVDCTSLDNKNSALTEKFRVLGLPTVVFLNGKGKELNNLRLVGFLGPAEMVKRMEKALSQ